MSITDICKIDLRYLDIGVPDQSCFSADYGYVVDGVTGSRRMYSMETPKRPHEEFRLKESVEVVYINGAKWIWTHSAFWVLNHARFFKLILMFISMTKLDATTS